MTTQPGGSEQSGTSANPSLLPNARQTRAGHFSNHDCYHSNVLLLMEVYPTSSHAQELMGSILHFSIYTIAMESLTKQSSETQQRWTSSLWQMVLVVNIDKHISVRWGEGLSMMTIIDKHLVSTVAMIFTECMLYNTPEFTTQFVTLQKTFTNQPST